MYYFRDDWRKKETTQTSISKAEGLKSDDMLEGETGKVFTSFKLISDINQQNKTSLQGSQRN